jgi:hypothetical protein
MMPLPAFSPHFLLTNKSTLFYTADHEKQSLINQFIGRPQGLINIQTLMLEEKT